MNQKCTHQLSFFFLLFFLCNLASFAANTAVEPNNTHFYEHIMKGEDLVNNESLEALFSSLNYDEYRYVDIERNIPVYNAKGEKMYDLVLISAKELQVEFQKPIVPTNIASNKDSRNVSIVLSSDNKLSIAEN